MKILVLGGTVFIGRYFVEAALHRGHEVTLFNRGISNTHLFPFVEKLRGDRRSDYNELKNRHWDAVIDTCCYYPSVVGLTLKHLKDSVDHYTFISSISVYENLLDPVESKEDDSTKSISNDELEKAEKIEIDNDEFQIYYGALKAKCEEAFKESISDKLLILRPGLIGGAYDDSDRFTYWPKRISEGGKVLAPGNPESFITFIDPKDLAIWNIKMLESKKTGVFNITGKYGELTFRSFFEKCREVSKSDAEFIWIEDETLEKHNPISFTLLPFYLSEKYKGLYNINIDKALSNHLAFSPVTDTISDSLSWQKERGTNIELKAGIPRKEEQKIIERYLSQRQP